MSRDTMGATEILDLAGRMGVRVSLSSIQGKIRIQSDPAPPLALMMLLIDNKSEILEALRNRVVTASA